MCQDLQAVLVVPHKLLVDVQHGQQDVEQVSCRHIKLFLITFHHVHSDKHLNECIMNKVMKFNKDMTLTKD